MPDGAKSLDWEKIIEASAQKMEEVFQIEIFMSRPVVKEIAGRIYKSLASLGLDHPNQAKIAGIAAFWIRKLKPLFQGPDATKIIMALNEYASLVVGLGICYRDPSSTRIMISTHGFDPRILADWVYSFRYNSHSPSSSIIAFETLLYNYNLLQKLLDAAHKPE